MSCGLVVGLHGCSRESSDICDRFYVNSGLNTWAEANNVVVLYPQNKHTTTHCWDWWGYSGSNSGRENHTPRRSRRRGSG